MGLYLEFLDFSKDMAATIRAFADNSSSVQAITTAKCQDVLEREEFYSQMWP